MLAVGAIALVSGCGRTSLDQSVIVAPRSGDAADASGAAADTSSDATHGDFLNADASDGCVGAPPIDPPIVVSEAQPFCGGEVAVSGTTPFGPFVASEVLVTVGAEDCNGHMMFTLYTGDISRPGELPDGLRLTFSTTYDGARRTWEGTFQTMAALSSTSPPQMVVPASVEITAADDPSGADGGAVNLSVPPTGEVRVHIDVGSGCAHVEGSFVAPYCYWAACI